MCDKFSTNSFARRVFNASQTRGGSKHSTPLPRKVSSMERLPAGIVYCVNCNKSDRIYLITITETVDPSVPVDANIPNVYPVSTLKCSHCGTVFDVERVDPRVITTITKIEFDNDFTVFTTREPHIAIRKAKKWYRQHFDGKLGNPHIIILGSDIYTTDPYDIVIPDGE
jgi:hypothetical protein